MIFRKQFKWFNNNFPPIVKISVTHSRNLVGFTNYGIVFSYILVGIRIKRIFVKSNDKNGI